MELAEIFARVGIDDPQQLLLISASYVDFAEAYFRDPDDPSKPLILEDGQRKAINALQHGYSIDDTPVNYINKNPPKGIVMIWPRQFGKCVLPETKIQLSDGSLKRFDELKEDSVISYNNKFVQSSKVSSFYNGKKDCYKIKTRSGREINCSLNHPFYTFSSYKEDIKYIEARDLKKGYKLAMCRELPPLGKEILSNNEIVFIAYMITEGGLTNWPPIFTNKTHEIICSWKKIVKDWSQVKYKGNFTISYRCKNKELKKLLMDLNLKDKLSKDKFIPQVIFKSTNEQVCLFLSKMIDCDGSIYNNTIEYSSASKRLIEDMSYLFTRIGMYGKIIKIKNQYRLIFTSSLNLLKAKKYLKLVKYKQKILDSINVSGDDHIDVFPINKNIIDFIKKKGMKRRDFEEKVGFKISYNNSGYCMRKINLIKKYFPDFEVDTSIYWDEIVSIKMLQKTATWGVEIPEFHNHLTNGFLTHNTTGVAIFCAVVLVVMPHVKIGVVSKDESGAMLIIDKIKLFLENSPFKSLISRSLKLMVQMKEGGIARAHANSETIRGFSYHFLLMDEAAKIDDSIIEEAALHTTRKIGIRWVMLSTPQGYKGALIKYYIQGLKTRTIICKSCLTEFIQPHFENAQFDALEMSKGLPPCTECGYYEPDDEYRGNTYFYGMGDYGVISVDPFKSSFYTKKEILRELELMGNTPKARQELLGEIIPEGQTVFTRDMLNLCINPLLKNVRNVNINNNYLMGVDFGKVHDNSVVCVGHEDRKTRKVILDYIFIIYSKYESIDYEDIKDKIIEIAGIFKPSIIAPDATGMGEPVVEMMEKDLRNMGWRGKILSNKKNRLGFIFDVKSKPDLIENLQEYFARGRIEMPSEYEPGMDILINELLNFSYEMTQANYIKYGVQLEHDDTVIALALMVWCVRSKPWIAPMIEYVGRGL